MFRYSILHTKLKYFSLLALNDDQSFSYQCFGERTVSICSVGSTSPFRISYLDDGWNIFLQNVGFYEPG